MVISPFHLIYSYIATDNLIAKLYESPKTILTTKDIALIWEETNTVNLTSKIKYYAKEGSLIRLTRGVFAKNKDYEAKELATNGMKFLTRIK